MNYDITLCANGDKCEERYTCRRYTTPPENRPYQSYANFFVAGAMCQNYLEVVR